MARNKRTRASITNVSRRFILLVIATFLVMLSLEGCVQSPSSSPPAISTPTATPHQPGTQLYLYRGHTDRVTAVAWSPDGKYIASGSLDQSVQVWEANTAKHALVFTYRGHKSGVQVLAWSPDSKRIASGSLDKTIQVWDALSGEHVSIFRGHTDTVVTIAWSPDGKYIASGSADGTMRVWEVATARQLYVYRGHTASINSLAWSPDGRQIVTGSSDTTAQIVDAMTGNRIYTYRGHTAVVSSVSWSPDGKLIASGSWDKTVQVWNSASGALVYTYNGYNVQAAQADPSKGVLPDLIFDVAWSHNGKRLMAVTQVYCGDICGIVMSWDTNTRRNFTFFVDQPIFSLAWSPDDTRLVISIVASTQGMEGHGTVPQDGAFVQIVQA